MSPNTVTLLPSLGLADLHVHFEGAIPDHALRRIAVRNCDEFTATDTIPGTFDTFFSTYRNRAGVLRMVDDIEFAAEATARSFVEQNVRYAEIHISPGLIARSCNAGIAEILLAAHRGFRRVAGVTVHLIVDVVRHHPLAQADEIVDVSIELQAEAGIVALGLGGREDTSLVIGHRRNFLRASARGLHLVAHAGEQSGPEDVLECVRMLEVERVGHALSAASSPLALDALLFARIPVEVCLSSNLALCGIGSLSEHPVRVFLEAGIPVILATDDPAIFNTSLEREFEHLATTGVSQSDLRHVAANAWRHAFGTEYELRRRRSSSCDTPPGVVGDSI